MELIIERDKWLRGEGSEDSRLLRPDDGKMCCLGFFSLACGLEPEQMSDIGAPEEPVVASVLRQNPQAVWLYHGLQKTLCSKDCFVLMNVNDDRSISEEQREAEITADFAKHGITVKFV